MAVHKIDKPPYPKELEGEEHLADGAIVSFRPIRTDDEPLLHDLAGHMTREDLRLRFFSPVRDISHALAVRLTHLDYDREMALVALHDGQTLGIARYSAGPDKAQAEYAVAVRSDWHGRGVGHLLMTRLIDIARRKGILELVGVVLRENRPMIDMCRALGFALASDPDDGALLRVRKALDRDKSARDDG